jgi:hypothetical protein
MVDCVHYFVHLLIASCFNRVTLHICSIWTNSLLLDANECLATDNARMLLLFMIDMVDTNLTSYWQCNQQLDYFGGKNSDVSELSTAPTQSIYSAIKTLF